jgi:hypothetical protein
MLWRRRHLPNPRGPEAHTAGREAYSGALLKRRFPWAAGSLLALAAGVAAYRWSGSTNPPSTEATVVSPATPFASGSANGLTVNLYNAEGGLSVTESEVLVEFRDSAGGAPVDVGLVKFALDMNMPGMVMHSGSTISPTGETGRYRVNIKPEMGGDWTAQLQYHGPRGSGEVSFTVNVKP